MALGADKRLEARGWGWKVDVVATLGMVAPAVLEERVADAEFLPANREAILEHAPAYAARHDGGNVIVRERGVEDFFEN